MTKFIGTKEQLINALTELSIRGNQTQEAICLEAVDVISSPKVKPLVWPSDEAGPRNHWSVSCPSGMVWQIICDEREEGAPDVIPYFNKGYWVYGPNMELVAKDLEGLSIAVGAVNNDREHRILSALE